MNWKRDYLEKLICGDKHTCYQLVQDYLFQESCPEETSRLLKALYYEVFQPTMQEIGTMWEQNAITVAQEHVATAITQQLMATLYPKIFAAQRLDTHKKVMISCPSGELHELPSRMLADMLALEGVDVIFVGASTPKEALIEMLQVEKPDMLILSCTLTRHVEEVKRIITAIRTSAFASAQVLVGGHAFDVEPHLYAHVGADFYAPTFKESIAIITESEEICPIAG